jgi:hypothetical protein
MYLPSKAEQTNDSTVSRSSGSGIELLSRQETMELREEFVSRINVEKDNQVVIELSKAGWSTMQSLLKDYEAGGDFGLEVEGWIEGIASKKMIQDQKFTFELSKSSKHSAQALQHAVRGPGLPTELEWLR